ncbi:proto-oncogene Mas-like [Pelobates fuscus]|uniref:proto-oncogene Mas-like n=1 Tax=Pelobates fuscus TaxID=191477 RepID=UPI002FE43601
MSDFSNGSQNVSTHKPSNTNGDLETYSIVACFAAILCLCGLIGNAVVTWVLLIQIKLNKYTVYILNLAIADFIYLLFVAIVMILMVDQMLNSRSPTELTLSALEIVYDLAYTAGMFFLTAISLERCLSVLFPIWYKCRRPKHLSSITCLLIWLLSIILSLVDNLICPAPSFMRGTHECTVIQIFTSVLTFAIILPLMLLSSFTLIYVIKTTSKKSRPPKIYMAIIVTVLVFLISIIPIRLLWVNLYFKVLSANAYYVGLFFASIYCTVFNSSANPFIYFFVGRQKKKKFGGSVNEALSRVFKEDDTEHSNGSYGTTSISSVG